jgi:hypothetical protein
MSYDSDRIAFYSELQTKWGSTTPLRFDSIQENDQITRGTDPWIHCNIDHFDTRQTSLGVATSVMYRTLGAFMIDVYDREENGFAQIMRHADTLNKMFMGKMLNNGLILVDRVSILTREPYMGWNSKRVSIHFTSTEYVSR